jgi:hypothetical protein
MSIIWKKYDQSFDWQDDHSFSLGDHYLSYGFIISNGFAIDRARRMQAPIRIWAEGALRAYEAKPAPTLSALSL